MVLNPDYYLAVFLVFVRIGGLMIAAPFFGHRSFPVRVRILFSILLAYIVVGFAGPPPPQAHHPVGFITALAIEAFTGVLMGFAAQFIFWAIQFGAELMGFQMGLSLAQVFNPATQSNSNPLGMLITMTFLLVFILLNGHHEIIKALVGSFQLIPLGGAQVGSGGPLLLEWMAQFFLTALQFAAPFLATFFMVELTLGIFARVVPQADLFSLSLPIKLIVGLSISAFFMQNLFPAIPGLVDDLFNDIIRLIEVIAPR